MIEIKTKETQAGAITVPPLRGEIQQNADKTVGVRMKVTPEIATEWLETRGSNRKVMQSFVDRYAEDMRQGRWVFNGAPIQFDEEGKLLNGQHRLWACIEAGFTIDSVIQWGIPRSAQATIDAGAIWKAKDVLYMQGETNTALLQASLAWLYREETGNIMVVKAMPNTVGVEMLKKHPNVRQSIAFYVGHSKGLLHASMEVYLHYKTSSVNPDKAAEFFSRLADGQDLSSSSPIYRLRERLLRHHGSKAKLNRVDMLALAIIAWNAFYRGAPVRNLTWRSYGPAAAAFPLIEGLCPGAATVKRVKSHRKTVYRHPGKKTLATATAQ